MITKQSIDEYVSTVDTVEALDKAIIDPFNTLVKEQAAPIAYQEEDITVKLNQTRSPNSYSAKNVLDLLQGTIQTAQVHNGNDRKMHGVKRFDGTVAMDVAYLGDCVAGWESAIIGYSTKQTVTYPKSVADEVRGEYQSQIFTLPQIDEISAHTVGLYIAARETSAQLKKDIIKPFETSAKKQAEKNDDKTIFDRTDYDNAIVQVKSVPRHEPDYAAALTSAKKMITAYASMSDDATGVFMNWEIASPRPYVDVNLLEKKLLKKVEKEDVKFRQEISVLYKPN